MKTPESLSTLVEYGIIQEVVRPLMSGKEAQVYVVVADGEECVAKVYKEANQRTFKHRSDYTEGRRTRNTRDQRAMSKRTQHGRKKDEDAWRNTEVEMIYRLRDAGVRVPAPINFVEGVLVMELVKDAEGHAAPRLGDLVFSPDEAVEIYLQLIREVVRMLCAGVIHGDLSDFNVLMAVDGPVVIDFPQAVQPTHNPNGQKLLLRDVENLHRFLARFAPGQSIRPYGQEIWSLFQANRLEPDTQLTGLHRGPEGKADTGDVMALIEDANRDEHFRRHGREVDEDDEFEPAPRSPVKAPPPRRTVVDFAREQSPRPGANRRAPRATEARSPRSARPASDARVPPRGPAAASTVKAPNASKGSHEAKSEGSPTNRRRRSRRGGRGRSPSATEPSRAGDGRSDAKEGASESRASGQARSGPRRPASSSSSAGDHKPSDRAPREEVGSETRPRRRRRSRRKPVTPN
jgi:RIO kinase 1